MKKNLKLVLALVLAAMMIVGSFAMAAEQLKSDPTLKISGLAEGDIVTLYKVVKWDNDPTNKNTVSGWIATSDYSTILTSDALKGILGVGTTATNITSTQAGQLARASVGTTPVNTTTLTSDTYEYTLAPDDGPGIYMALITPADPDTVYNPVFVSSDWKYDNTTSEWIVESGTEAYASSDGAAKKAKSELDKQASTSEDSWDDPADTLTAAAAGKLHWTTTAVGDTVNFTVTTTIPGYGNIYQTPTFELHDKLTDLQLKANSIKVYEGDTTGTLLTTAEYTAEAFDDQYTLKFKSDYLKQHKVPHQITVTYDAVVTSTAALNVNPEKNEVSTKFSHTPSSETDYAFKKDTTNHYTFSIDANGLFHDIHRSGEYGAELVKVGVNADGSPITSEKTWSKVNPDESVQGPLVDAEFGLYTDAACTTPYVPKDANGNSTTAFTVTTGADGRMNIPGLDAGTYYLKEIHAPTGYVASDEVVRIDIEAIVELVDVTEYTSDGVAWYSEYSDAHPKSYTYQTEVLKEYTIKINGHENVTHTFLHESGSTDIIWHSAGSSEIPTSIKNVKGIELPSTGGIGTTIFYVGGSLMVLAAAILLITKRRMGVED